MTAVSARHPLYWEPKDNGSRPGTPWGQADSPREYGGGVRFCSAPAHGGYFGPKRTRARYMPEGIDGDNGWFEEDCAYCFVYVYLFHLMPTVTYRGDNTLAAGLKTMAASFPMHYLAWCEDNGCEPLNLYGRASSIDKSAWHYKMHWPVETAA